MIERTLVFVKPDGVQRGLTGAITSRFEQVGLKIVAAKLQKPSEVLAKKHYAEHKDKPFYQMLVDTLVEQPVMVMVLEGVGAIKLVRKLVGATEPAEASPGTIRGDYCQLSYKYVTAHGKAIRNTVHASANKEDAAKEIALWFSPEEIISYTIDSEEHHR